MNKINHLLILLLVSAILLGCQEANINKVTCVRVKSVDFELMTIISVKCNDFENYFNTINDTILYDTIMISRLLEEFSSLENPDSTYSKLIDTRAKIEIINTKDTTLICVGNLSLVKDGVHYKTPKSLIELIESYY